MLKNQAPLTLNNRIAFIPETLVRCVGKAIIFRYTTQYSTSHTPGGLVMPGGERDPLEKKYDYGQVVQVGPDVVLCKPGDILLYHTPTAWRLPNSMGGIPFYKINETPDAVVAVLPPLEPFESLCLPAPGAEPLEELYSYKGDFQRAHKEWADRKAVWDAEIEQYRAHWVATGGQEDVDGGAPTNFDPVKSEKATRLVKLVK